MEEFNDNVGFIGAGKMAYALTSGMLKSGLLESERIWASAPSMTNLKNFQDLNCNITHSNSDVLANCTIVFLCVKPHLTSNVLEKLYCCWKQNHIIVSVIGGVTLKFLEEKTPPHTEIIRSMPNVSSVVLAGMCGISRGTFTKDSSVKLVEKLLRTVGLCEEVNENQMDAVCGLSGSGPAFIFTVIQSMADGAVKMGIPKSVAIKFAAQTALGASKMILETGEHPEVLRDSVCSPGGTTITGIHVLENAGVRAAMMNAVEAAALKAKELGKQ